MKILITAYAVNPYKGSEDGMGWHYISQAARGHEVVAVTRKNNRAAIERFMEETKAGNEALYSRIRFRYFDWPRWMIFWKKGPLLSMIYYYAWQFSLALQLRSTAAQVDIVHNLNFHNDWTPSFLWLSGKPFAWGPVGHHPRIPAAFVLPYGRKEWFKDRALWVLKWSFWHLDPLLYLSRKKAGNIWCMHEEAARKLRLKNHHFVHPSIAAPATQVQHKPGSRFIVLSIGRFVALKGFDVTIRAFAAFYRQLPFDRRSAVQLMLVGKGPAKAMIEQLIEDEGISQVTVIRDWMPQHELSTLYSEASVFLYPSHEGAGMVVAEAMSYGLPVICWNNAGPGTIVHPDSNLRVDYKSYDESIRRFAAQLDRLFRDHRFYEHESNLALERFQASLDWNVKAAQLKTFYTTTINNHNSRK